MQTWNYFSTWKYLSYSHFICSLSVPCAPTNISTNLLCGTNELVVGWNSSVPLNYSVKVVPLAGNISSLTCDTSHANCRLSGLRCGQAYNVSVKASSANCSGPSSHPQTIQTGIKKNYGSEIRTATCCWLIYSMPCDVLPQHPALLRDSRQ